MRRQQQTVVTNAGLVQPLYISQPYQTACEVSSYRHRQSTIGAMLIVGGSMSVISSVVGIAITIIFLRSTDGIWCGVMIIIAGAFGIGAGRRKSRCVIITFLVLAIIGSISAAFQAFRAIILVAVFRKDIIHEDSRMAAAFSMAVVLAILGACEFGLCLWGSILCCATSRCSVSQPVVFMTVAAGGEPVAMVQRPGDQPTQQHRDEGATDVFHPMSDITNRQATATYEPLDENRQRPVNYQQLPPQTGHERSYYNVGRSANTNGMSPYEELDINRQRSPVYEQLDNR